MLVTVRRCVRRMLISMALAAMTVSLPAERAAAQADAKGEWPQFLGPTRNGLSAETGLLDRWPTDGPKEIWRVPGGVGMSGLAISRGRVLTLVQREGKQWLVALEAKTGESVWETPLAPEYRNPMGNGPRGTPAIAGELVFVFTGEGILSAHAFADGKQLWSHNVVKELSGKEAEYGMACSPLVVGEQVIVTAGASKGTLVAFDTKSGKQLWTAGSDPAGYSSPALLNVGGRSQIVAFTGSSALGVDPAKGSVLWRYPFKTNYECNIATPLEIKGQVFLSAGENHGSVLLALKPQDEKFTLSEVWDSFGPKSVLRNEWQTSMLLDGHLYGMDNVGGAGPVTHLTCIDAVTGERKWQEARFGKGNLIAADGKLFITTMKGELVLARATPDRYNELGRATVLESTRQAPALSNGRLFLRDDKEIVCLDVRNR
ncbi:alcohol dehydrogenase [Planctomycetia bacterium]|nr:alcohol dehydrogenase [Planctomycetia bacterium]